MSTEPDPQDGSKPWDPFPGIADITAWLDESNPASPHEDSMRVMKVGEEAGEAIAAYIGMVGQNPRKGVTHTQDDLLKELADVAITALCAMQHFTQDEAVTRAYMAAKIQAIIERSDIHVRVRSGPAEQPQDERDGDDDVRAVARAVNILDSVLNHGYARDAIDVRALLLDRFADRIAELDAREAKAEAER